MIYFCQNKSAVIKPRWAMLTGMQHFFFTSREKILLVQCLYHFEAYIVPNFSMVTTKYSEFLIFNDWWNKRWRTTAFGKQTHSIFLFLFLRLASGNLSSSTKHFFSLQEKSPLAKTFIPLCSIRSTEFQYGNCDIIFFAVLLIEEPTSDGGPLSWQNSCLALGW